MAIEEPNMYLIMIIIQNCFFKKRKLFHKKNVIYSLRHYCEYS